MHPYVHRSITHGGQDIKTSNVSFDRWLAKEDVVYVYGGILLSHKKRWDTAICDNMDGSWEYYAKWNKSEKAKNHVISLICGMQNWHS